MASMTNAVRLASVLSKFGEATPADIGKLMSTRMLSTISL